MLALRQAPAKQVVSPGAFDYGHICGIDLLTSGLVDKACAHLSPGLPVHKTHWRFRRARHAQTIAYLREYWHHRCDRPTFARQQILKSIRIFLIASSLD